jgi:hypothetical protein
MKNAALKYGIGAAALLAGAMAFNPAQAALVDCPASFTTDPTAKVEDPTGTTTAASACQYVEPPDNSNTASIENINEEGFFGHTDWESNGQDQLAGAGQTGASGTWSIANPDFETFDYAIFFKDGSNTNLVGFLFNEDFTSGVWSTPFTEPPFDLSGDSTSHDVSHFTIARVPGVDEVPVPEPSSLIVFGTALLGLGWLARRRKV